MKCNLSWTTYLRTDTNLLAHHLMIPSSQTLVHAGLSGAEVSSAGGNVYGGRSIGKMRRYAKSAQDFVNVTRHGERQIWW